MLTGPIGRAAFCGSGALLHQRGVLPAGGGGDFRNPIDHTAHRLHNLLHGGARIRDQLGARCDLVHGGANQALNFSGRFCAEPGQAAYLTGDHRKATALLAGACRLDRSVKCQDIVLKSNAVDDTDDVGDLLAACVRLLMLFAVEARWLEVCSVRCAKSLLPLAISKLAVAM